LQIVVPVICVLLSMLFTLLVFVETDPLEIHPEMYDQFGFDEQDFETANCATLLNASNWDKRLLHTVVANATNGGALSQHLIDTFKKHGNARFNAMFCNDATLSALTSAASSMLFYNATGFHSIIDVTNQYYRNYLRTQTGNTSADVRLTMQPWALTEREDALFSSIRTILIGIIIMIPFTFIPSTFVSWIVKERECKAKHLQTSSGLNFFVYWTSNMVFDFLSVLVTIALVLIVFLIFNRTEYIGNGENFGATLFLFIAYGLAGIAGAYFVSFAFEEHSQAQNVVMLSNFIAGFLLVLVIFILDDLGGSTKDAATVLKFICRLIPSYCLGEGIINMAVADLQTTFNVQSNRFDLDVV
ncbi:MAG: ABC transporter permease, partial [Flavobacteriaceae bacterium]|nr:ABC transporter permease [Flavobacteriaceae bacterium]